MTDIKLDLFPIPSSHERTLVFLRLFDFDFGPGYVEAGGEEIVFEHH